MGPKHANMLTVNILKNILTVKNEGGYNVKIGFKVTSEIYVGDV